MYNFSLSSSLSYLLQSIRREEEKGYERNRGRRVRVCCCSMAGYDLLGGRQLRSAQFRTLHRHICAGGASGAAKRHFATIGDAVGSGVRAATIRFEGAVDDTRRANKHVHRTTTIILAPGVEGRGSEEWGGGHGAHGGSSGGHAAHDEESVRKMSGEPR